MVEVRVLKSVVEVAVDLHGGGMGHGEPTGQCKSTPWCGNASERNRTDTEDERRERSLTFSTPERYLPTTSTNPERCWWKSCGRAPVTGSGFCVLTLPGS